MPRSASRHRIKQRTCSYLSNCGNQHYNHARILLGTIQQDSVTMDVISTPARQFDPDSPMVYVQSDAATNPRRSRQVSLDVFC
ncbi:MAG TPA: hypothetical protein VF088_21405 [Pyrinomonadaceae bacterium]